MKRILSMLLALCMIISLAPSVFAEGEAVDITAKSGITVKYDFTNFVGAESNGQPTGVNYDKSYDFWSYKKGPESATWDERADGNTTESNNTKFFQFSTSELMGSETKDFVVAFEINVPKSGVYTVKLDNMQCKSYGGSAKFYVLPADTTDPAAEIKAENADSSYLLGDEFTFCASTTKDYQFGSKSEVLGEKYFEKGKHMVAYAVTKKNQGVGTFESHTIYLRGITLDGGSDLVPMSMDVSVDKTALTVGDENNATATMTAKVYMSDGTEITEGIAYTSSNDKIASVDTSGNITAKAYGDATITASVTVGDCTVEASKEVSVSAPGIEIKYTVGTDSDNETDNGFLTALTPTYTNGFYSFAGTNSEKDNGNYKQDEGEQDVYTHLRPRKGYKNFQLYNTIAASFKVYIPQAGIYTMEMKNGEYSSAGKVHVYLTTEDKLSLKYGNESLGTNLGWYSCDNDNASGVFTSLVSEPNVIRNIEIEEPGEYVFSFLAEEYGSVGDFTLKNGTGLVVPMSAPVTIEGDKASVANTVVMSDKTTQALDNTFTVTYDSSDKSVATVANDGTITKLSNGKTMITAKVSKNGGMAISSAEYEVTGMVPKYSTATFSAVTNVAGNDVLVTVDGIANENEIISAPRGSAIEATAPEIPGYKFVGWKRGSNNADDNYGSYISDKNPLEMCLLTNTFVTACYVTESYENEAVVEYYNQNGDYIETKSKDEAAPTPGAITGFTFEAGNWFIGENAKLDLGAVTSLTRAVARHTPNANVGTVKVNNVEQTEKAFDSAITPAATENFTCWKRDGKVVSYSKDYTYYLWDDTSIEESKDAIPETAYSGGKKLPLIVLESGNGGAYMIEYDKADFEIVEVGILFGSGDITVDSCDAKYTSQRNSAHGQFTAKADGTAKGYLIYKDGDAYKVIYATAE